MGINGNIQQNTSNSAASVGGTLAGSIGSGLVNMANNYLNYRYSKKLTDYNYEQYFDNARKAGATPAAIAAGITGSPGGFSGSSVTNGNPMPDVGAAYNNNIGARASMINAGANQENADTERNYKNMLIQYEPKLFRSQAFEATAKAFRDIFGIRLDASQKKLFDEEASQISLLKPWKVETAKQTLNNLIAEHGRIVAETGLFKERQKTEKSLQDYYKSSAEVNWEEKFNKAQEGFRLMWENDLRSIGFDPSKNVFQNMLRNSFTNPKLFKLEVDGLVRTLNILDYEMQEHVHKHYKEFGLGFGIGTLLHSRNREGLHDLLKVVSAAGALL